MNWLLLKSRVYSWNLLVLLFIIISIGVTVSMYSIMKAEDIVKNSLLERTDIISTVFEIEKIKSLHGNEEDLNNPAYTETKDKLIKLAQINSDTRFVYIVGKKDGDIFFFADSELADSEDYSPPGQVYDEASEIFRSVFDDKISKIEGPITDRWGSWISSMSPIIDTSTGQVIALVGLDVSVRDYYTTLVLYGSIPLLVALLFASFTFFIYRAQKKEEVLLTLRSELVSIAAHDLRTPLIGIRWSLDSIIDSSNNLTEEQKNNIDLMRNASTKLLETANEILETSKLDKQNEKALTLESCDIIPTLNEIIAIFIIPAQEKSVKIIVDSSMPESLIIKCDKSKIKRAFSNLISNAIKYSLPGKEIIMRYSQTLSTCTISITNEGMGIAKSEQNNIFKEYYRTKEIKKSNTYGTGLGLYYVKRIIDLHKGKVWFESREGAGATFFVELPKK